ncbi:MAG TPA: SDR family oxidoreductase [Sphingomonadaceae bacterium]|nr:SDR family oxidoreductase [Sphingomonadaceae bacterium]
MAEAGPAPIALDGRVVVVTGAGGGLGLAITRALARAGARLVVTDRDEAGAGRARDAAAAEGAEAVAAAGDIATEAGCAAVAEAARGGFGGVDGLVNNAGLLSALPLRRWDEIPVAEWDAVMAVNVRGMFLCARAIVPLMRPRGGAIVNMSSGRALDPGTHRLHYATSKAGVLGFTRALARELGPEGIRVNAVTPGYVVPDASGAPGHDGPAFAPDGRALGRAMESGDLTGVVAFLLSDAARFMTGQTINVDGGKILY